MSTTRRRRRARSSKPCARRRTIFTCAAGVSESRDRAGRGGPARKPADRLAEGETEQAETDRTAREALAALSSARESAAAAQARRGPAGAAAELDLAIRDNLRPRPDGLYQLAGLEPGAEPPPAASRGQAPDPASMIASASARSICARKTNARDRGAAGTRWAHERDDLVEAIKRLRQAVSSPSNREGAIASGGFRRGQRAIQGAVCEPCSAR